jgi:hypothetical protein
MSVFYREIADLSRERPPPSAKTLNPSNPIPNYIVLIYLATVAVMAIFCGIFQTAGK